MSTLAEHMIAPGATRGEMIAALAAGITGAATVSALAIDAGLDWWRIAVIVFVAFDIFGGVVVNATASAKRRYHGPGRDARHHLGFVAIHLQPFLLAWAVPGFGWAPAAAIYLLALLGGVIVTSTPLSLRRPVAYGVTAIGVLAATSLLTVPQPAAWFAPVLLIKLLLAHLLPEEAAQPVDGRAATT